MKVFAYMEHGKYKTSSEDTMIANCEICKDGYFVFNSPGNCIAIADGVGGNAGGMEASEFVAEKLKAGLSDEIRTAVFKINYDLLSDALSVPGKEKMATTLTALLFSDNKPSYILHVGNTRLSAIQGEYLKQLTRDHTTVEYLKTRGDYEAAEKAAQNEITACFGSGNASALNQLQINEIDRDYSGFVLTSDGIHDYLDEEEIESFVSAGDYSENAFRGLAQQAKELGSTDDMSIIIVKLREC